MIIPLRLTALTFEGAERLRRICKIVPADLFDIVISDYGTAAADFGPLSEMETDRIRIVRHPKPHALFSIGHCRDFGAQMARRAVIMFHDIDFLGDEQTYRSIHAEVMARDMASNLFDFFCVPVLFLTEAGTSAYFERSAAGKHLLPDSTLETLEAADALVQSAAFGSSAMVINRHHYLSIGGHDPDFHGHGAEDYDLLHRLSSLAPKGLRPHDYATDFKSNNVRRYWGFRAFFALYGIDLYAKGLHLVHLWHPRRKEKGYFRPNRNFRILKRAMRKFDRTGQQPPPLADLNAERRILIFSRQGRAAAARLRQLLPRFAGYKVLTAPARNGGVQMLAEAAKEGVSDVLAFDLSGPELTDGMADEFRKAGIRLVVATSEPSGAQLIFADKSCEPIQQFVARKLVMVTRSGEPLEGYFSSLQFPGFAELRSGTIPAPHAATSPLFSSFGGEAAFAYQRHAKPKRKKKSPLWVRFKRFLTGY